jgi:formate dehydrogenase
MDLLDKMTGIQEADGAVTDEALRALAKSAHVPLYRLEGLRGFYPIFRAQPGAPTQVHVCRDLACVMAGGPGFPRRVQVALAGVPGVETHEVSCLGRCDSAPACAVNGTPVSGTAQEVAAYATGRAPLPPDPPRSEPRRWTTDPYDGAAQHYGVLRAMLSGTGAGKLDLALDVLKASGLRGMGGAGFPTGQKWELTRKAPGAPKYVVCNADESEPGTFKDRMILEELPHLVIEAMVLGGWVTGAGQGIVYLRHEYGRARKALEEALDHARRTNILGPSVLGSGWGFDIRLFVSPGGYILGEETALLEALEDKRGEPRNKPPFPTQHGLWGQPTLMNNVETLAAVPIILMRGAEWWIAQGRNGAKGLKFLSVSGDVAVPGVYCVPLGTTVAELLALCGGMADGKRLYAFAPGGASSNFLPASQRDVPLDFQPLQQAGSMLGSGAVVFVAEGRDLLALGSNVLRFFRNESCGKCVPCRVGTEKASAWMERALAGNAPPGLVPRLRELGATLAQTSICGLGQIALQPLLSVVANFPAEAAKLGEPARQTPAKAPASAAGKSARRPKSKPAARPAAGKPTRGAQKVVPKTAARKAQASPKPAAKPKAGRKAAPKSRPAAKRPAKSARLVTRTARSTTPAKRK